MKTAAKRAKKAGKRAKKAGKRAKKAGKKKLQALNAVNRRRLEPRAKPASGQPREATLRDLRRERGLPQAELGAKLGLAQNQVSRVERGPLGSVGLLRRWVAELGGELEVMVTIGGERIRLEDP